MIIFAISRYQARGDVLEVEGDVCIDRCVHPEVSDVTVRTRLLRSSHDRRAYFDVSNMCVANPREVCHCTLRFHSAPTCVRTPNASMNKQTSDALLILFPGTYLSPSTPRPQTGTELLAKVS